LALPAAHREQQLQGLVVLDAFGHHAQPQMAPQIDNRAHDGLLPSIIDVPHKRAVDLQLVYRQTDQTRQRRVAGAEVVDRDLEAAFPQGADVLENQLSVLDETVFGDLDC
jgi:hypothetical protein